jgi:hypothetical protein
MKYTDEMLYDALQRYEEGLSFSGGLEDPNDEWGEIDEY